MDENTKQLILEAQQANREAFHQLVAQHDERIMTLALQLTKNRQDAEDLYQDVFLKAFRKIHQFRFESEFYTWLYRITVNTAYNLSRKRSRIQVADPRSGDERDPLTLIPGDDRTDDHATEIMQQVRKALQELPKQQQIVFILKHLQNLKIKDIAAIMGISDGTVKKYLFRAVEKLRAQLKEIRYA
ncbi:MAG: RNA polymerase sigma factor [Fidelibacterota bacterium]